MLKVFLLSPDLLSVQHLDGEQMRALGQLFREAFRPASVVCLALPGRPELQQLLALVKRLWSDPDRGKLLALFDRHLPIGQGIHCLDLKDGDANQRWRKCCEVTRADFSIAGSPQGFARDVRRGKHQMQLIRLEELANVLDGLSDQEFSFGHCRLSKELDDAVAGIVRIRPELSIIDPYFGKSAGTDHQNFRLEGLAVQKFAAALHDSVELLGGHPKVEVLVAKGKLRAALKARKPSEREMAEAEERAVARIKDLFKAEGIDPSCVQVLLLEEDFTLRGLRCAAKFWRLEHNLLQLGKRIHELSAQAGKGTPSGPPKTREPILAPCPPKTSAECQDLLNRGRGGSRM